MGRFNAAVCEKFDTRLDFGLDIIGPNINGTRNGTSVFSD